MLYSKSQEAILMKEESNIFDRRSYKQGFPKKQQLTGDRKNKIS